MKKLWMIALVTLTMCKGVAEKESESDLLTPLQFQEKIASTPDAVILDVRSVDEVRDGYIKGEINFDFKSEGFKTLLQGLDKNKTYFVYCAGGVRSAKAANIMKEIDFKKVYTLDGGIEAWKKAGLPVKSAVPR